MLNLDQQEITKDVLFEKYIKNDETSQIDIFKRVAKGVAQAEKEELREKYEQIFYNNMLNGGIGAGRIMSSGGTNLSVTMINCFVIDVGDSIEGVDENGHPGIYESVKLAACTMRKGGGVGYNFSKIRPKGAEIKSSDSIASGPCSYIDLFDISCLTIESAGCFTGETLIDTTEGLITIKEIVESNKDYYAITHMGPKKITTKFKTGIKPIWNVKTTSGLNVRVSKDHKFAQYRDNKIITVPISEIVNSNNNSLILLESTLTKSGRVFSKLSDTSISAIEIEEPRETYDLEVEDVHLLSGNGIYSSNSRRGAQLAALNIDHPDILEFIKAKRTKGRWNNFNISVLVPDSFMKIKESDGYIELVHKAKPGKKLIENGAYQRADGKWVYNKIKAKELWNIIMKSNYDYAEPGILFEDNINRDNNLRYIEYIDTTNPGVTGETLILTKSLGYVPIENLVGQEVEIWNGYEWSFVTPKVTGENKEIYKISLSDGSYLLCTSNHTFVLDNNLKITADELPINAKLAKPTYPIIESIFNEDDVYIFNKYNVPTIAKSINYRISWLGDYIDNFSIKCKDKIVLLSGNKDTLYQIKYMLNTLGVNGCLYFEPSFKIYLLIISGYDINCLKKLGLKTNFFNLDDIIDKKDTNDLIVINKEKLPELASKVYCFTEPKNHTGIFNGILTGNCGE